MTNEIDGNGNLLPDEIRLTDLGRVLRSTSLDELPSFELFTEYHKYYDGEVETRTHTVWR